MEDHNDVKGIGPRKKGRRYFIGGSDARIIMGDDEAALIRLWHEKRGEIKPEDLSGNLIVQLGLATEKLNRRWYQANTGRVVTDVQMWRRHPTLPWMAATLDGRVEGGDVFDSKFMLPWQFSEDAAAVKHAAQLQHNMWVVAARGAILSVISGGGRWVEIKTHADPLYQHLIVTAERKFWRCVETGEPPVLFGAEPPKPRIEAVAHCRHDLIKRRTRQLAAIFSRTRSAHLEHEQARGNSSAWCPMTRSRRSAMASEPSARNRCHQFRPRQRGRRPCSGAVVRSALGGRACQSTGRTRQSGEVAGRNHPSGWTRWGRADLSLCAAIEWARHRPQNPRPARDCDGANDLDRSGGRHHQSHHGMAHASGEWIASDWPVCAISDTATRTVWERR